jgi:hypothetical protein
MVMFFILLNPFPFDSIINEHTSLVEAQNAFSLQQDSNLGSHTCNTLSLPLDHLTYTCFNTFFILLDTFSSRVELINNDA